MLVEVLFCYLVKTDDTVLAARFDRHIRYRHPSFHRHMLQRRSDKLHRSVERTVGTYKPYRFEYHIFAVYPGLKVAVKNELHRFGNLKPKLSGCDRSGKVSRTDTGTERTKRAIRTGMRIAADNNFARPNMPLLRKQRMTNTGLADRVIMLDPFFLRPRIEPLMKLCAFNILRRLKVIGSNHDLFRIENLIDTIFLKHRDRRRRSNIMAHHNIDVSINKIARLNRVLAGRPGKYFFSNSHTHFKILISF